MAFLDNSGDIILDAVLTDAGRARLAAGDGSFKIVKYAFGDDEIDYAKYDKNNASGSAYYDIQILRTPILEAFTNNTSTMKSKLISIPRTNLLYLPVIMLNEMEETPSGGGMAKNITDGQATDNFVVSVDSDTDSAFSAADSINTTGVLLGVSSTSGGKYIQTDQGLNTTAISQKQSLDTTLIETQFIVEMDNRLGSLSNPQGTQVSYSYLDDDNIASYNITNAGQGSNFFTTLGTDSRDSPIRGPRGVGFRFRFLPSLELQSSTYLFDRIGTSGGSWSGVTGTFSHIDTIVKITGATTGYSIDIPVRYIKKTA
tara:strand:+ start:694 stop:1635 length:942 start_codon:yes stop_codon:yes gene_type:complete